MNPVLLQKQLRENANDLQDFCKDLQSWGEEMKRKEQSLKQGTSSKSNDPEPSTSKVPKISEDKNTSKKLKNTATKRGVTDYSKWEKFDADLECERLEDDFEDDSELTDETDLMARDEAHLQKEKGNKLVKNKEWDKAIECYTKAINSYSYDPVYYANRALCYLKKGDLKKAESDCTLSLKLDQSYVKAYQRRAAARENLNMLKEAQEDLVNVLQFEPKNSESLAALQKINKKIGEPNQDTEQRPVSKFTASRNKSKSVAQPNVIVSSLKEKQNEIVSNKPILPEIDTSQPSYIWSHNDDIILVKPTKKPIHLRSKKPLKRIEIKEIDNSIKSEEKINQNIAIKGHVVEKIAAGSGDEALRNPIIEKVQKKVQFAEKAEFEPDLIISESSEKFESEPKKIESAFKKTRSEKSVTNVINDDAWPKATNNPSLVKSNDLKIVERKNNENVSKEEKNNSNLNISTEKCFLAPKTSVQFYSQWRNLKSADDKYKFLKLVEPQDIPNIFKESLESKVFSDILKILAQEFVENNDPVYDILSNFTLVKRFSALTLFMDSDDKNCLWKLLDNIKEREGRTKEEVDNLVRIYEM